MYKILIPFKNTLDGTIINPNSGNEYRDILSFENENVKSQYIDMYLFENKIGDYKEIIKDYNYNVDLIWNDENSASLSVNVDYLNKSVNGIDFKYDLEDLLQKDFIIVYNENKDNFWFFSITGAVSDKNNVSIVYSLEINEFWNNDFKSMFQGDITINSGQVNRYSFVSYWNENYNENDLISDTYKTLDKKLEKVSREEWEDIHGETLNDARAAMYDKLRDTLWIYIRVKSKDKESTKGYEVLDEGYKIYNNTDNSTDDDYIDVPGRLYFTRMDLKNTMIIGKPGTYVYTYYFTLEETIKAIGRKNIDYMCISNMVPFDITTLDCFVPESGDEPSTDFDVGFNAGNSEDIGIEFSPNPSKHAAVYIKRINPFKTNKLKTYSLDLTSEGFLEQSISDSPRFQNEINANQSHRFNIKSIYSKDSFIVPPKYYGKKLYFKNETTNFDGNENVFLRLFKYKDKDGVYHVIEDGEGIGFNEQFNSMLPASNSVYETYKTNNSSSLALQKMGGALSILSAPVLLGKGKVGAAGAALFGSVSMGAKIADMKRAPNEITPFSSDILSKYSLSRERNFFICVEEKPKGGALRMKEWDNIKNGVVINLISSTPFWSERYYFNKIDYSSVYSNINLDIAPKRKQIIADSCESGDMTVWHVRDLNTFKGIKKYKYENLEMNLVKKNESKRN